MLRIRVLITSLGYAPLAILKPCRGGPKHAHGSALTPQGTATGVCEIKAAGPYKFIRVGGIDVTKPYEFIWFGDIHAAKP